MNSKHSPCNVTESETIVLDAHLYSGPPGRLLGSTALRQRCTRAPFINNRDHAFMF